MWPLRLLSSINGFTLKMNLLWSVHLCNMTLNCIPILLEASVTLIGPIIWTVNLKLEYLLRAIALQKVRRHYCNVTIIHLVGTAHKMPQN